MRGREGERERGREGERERGRERVKRVVINCWQNENWSPKLKIEWKEKCHRMVEEQAKILLSRTRNA